MSLPLANAAFLSKREILGPAAISMHVYVSCTCKGLIIIAIVSYFNGCFIKITY